MDTIFALATAPGRAGVAVIRISGPAATNAAEHLLGPLPKPRQTAVRDLRIDGALIDRPLVLVFGQGASFTGEEVVELHLHGSPLIVRRVLAALEGLTGLRHAEAGEFTRRALENDRLDLTQVEGLSALLEAETEAQRELAMRVFDGSIGRQAQIWRGELTACLALVEASIDFADEEIPDTVRSDLKVRIGDLSASFRREADGALAAERLREGFEVAILGEPNTGKSTLINALAGREAAITSPHAGTTRDVIEVRFDLHGLPVTFLDTAGLRESTDEVERIGIDRARDRADRADLRLLMGESAEVERRDPADILIHPMADLSTGKGIPVSGKTGQGIDELIVVLNDILSQRLQGIGSVSRDRHRHTLLLAQSHLAEVLESWDALAEEMISYHLRGAVSAMDMLVGKIGVEDVLGQIFASFCIGK